jgi:hypothetical protein
MAIPFVCIQATPSGFEWMAAVWKKTTDGRINPFGATYDEFGYQYSSDSHSMPIYQLIWGGNYTQWGKKEPSMGFAPTMMDYQLILRDGRPGLLYGYPFP